MIVTCPNTWNKGSAVPKWSSAVISMASMTDRALPWIPRWVSWAPLGCPVVPDVYMITAPSPGSTSRGWATGGPVHSAASFTFQTGTRSSSPARET